MFWCDSRGRGGWTRAIKKDEDTLWSVLLQFCFWDSAATNLLVLQWLFSQDRCLKRWKRSYHRYEQGWAVARGNSRAQRKHQRQENHNTASSSGLLTSKQSPQMCTTQSSPQLQTKHTRNNHKFRGTCTQICTCIQTHMVLNSWHHLPELKRPRNLSQIHTTLLSCVSGSRLRTYFGAVWTQSCKVKQVFWLQALNYP